MKLSKPNIKKPASPLKRLARLATLIGAILIVVSVPALVSGSDNPVVASVTPDFGPPTGGTAITINGSNLGEVTAVSIGGLAAQFTVNSSTQISAITPAHRPGAVRISLTSPHGTSATAIFTYKSAIVTLPSPSPAVTATLTPITITPIRRTPVVTATTVAASPTVTTTPALTVSPSPVVITTGPVSTTPSVTATETASTTPSITPTVTPTTIAPSVEATPTSVATSTSTTSKTQTPTATATNPAPTTAPSSPTATPMDSTPSPTASVITPTLTPRGPVIAPVILGLKPNSGKISGGATVLISGVSFNRVTAVTFGGVRAKGFTIKSASQIEVVVPAHAAGVVAVAVSTGSATTSLSGAFTYQGALSILEPPTSLNYTGKLNGNMLRLTSSFEITVDDATAKGAGWSLQAWVKLTGPSPIPAKNHTIQSVSIKSFEGRAPVNSLNYPLAMPSDWGDIFRAAPGTGTGQTTLVFQTELLIPSEAMAGSYEISMDSRVVAGS